MEKRGGCSLLSLNSSWGGEKEPFLLSKSMSCISNDESPCMPLLRFCSKVCLKDIVDGSEFVVEVMLEKSRMSLMSAVDVVKVVNGVCN